MKVIAIFEEGGSVLEGTKCGTPLSFSIELSLDSDEPEHEIADLIQLAHNMCFTEKALSHAIPLTYSHHHNGKLLQIDSLGV